MYACVHACACVCTRAYPAVSDSFWPHELQPTRLFCPWNSPGKNTGVGCHSLLQGVFLTQGSNLGLLHCRQTLYHWATRKAPESKTNCQFFSGHCVPLTTIQDQLWHGGVSSLVWILCWLNGRKSLASLRNTSSQFYCLGPLEFQWLYARVAGGRVISAYV